MPTNREKVIHLIRTSTQLLDDDEIARQTGISPRQTVNIICRQLVQEGSLRRVPGARGKIVNEWIGGNEPSDPAAPTQPDGEQAGGGAVLAAEARELPRGSSHVQRRAERVLLDLLGHNLGVRLDQARITIPSGARVEVDGTDEGKTVLVECWAHQGPPKPAQKNKILSDALKLTWIATTIYPRPRLVLCLSDPEAAAPFTEGARTWASQALADLGIEVIVVDLPDELRLDIVAAQERQYR